jgi:3',5'-cyclic AMP phosphodiesterase CpdA
MRKIAQLSDLHFGRHSLKVMEDLLTSVNEHRPDLVVFSGDFTQRARSAEFAEARHFLNRLSQPKLVVPGNHDVPLYNVFARFLYPFKKYNHYVAPVGHPSSFFSDDEIAILGLNTARRFTRKNGRISLSQVSEIGRTFRDLPHGIFKALVTHHPLGVPSGEGPVELVGRSRLALKSIADVGVRLLLSGHHHRALSGDMTHMGGEGSVLVVHAGTAISSRIRAEDGNTYNLISIDSERVSVSVMESVAGHGFREKCATHYMFQHGQWLPAKLS